MNDKKNIDRLFQERFKDFETIPDPKNWDIIHDSLHQKKHKKVMPFWWKLSGTAAGLILAYMAFSTLWTPSNTETKVVIAPKEFKNKSQNEVNVTSESESKFAVEIIDSSDNTIVLKAIEKNSNPKTAVASANNNSTIEAIDAEVPLNKKSKTAKNKVKQNATLKNAFNPSLNKEIATNSVQKNSLKSIEKDTHSEQAVLSNSLNQENSDSQSLQNQFNTKKQNEISVFSKNSTLSNTKLPKQTQDTTLLNVEKNPLEELLKKKNEKGEVVLAHAKINRWQVTTNVAPIFFNSATNGSPIESQFEENSKSYENNLSVGVGIQYAVTKKLAIRAGFNTVTLGYGTNDVVFFGGLSASGVSNLSPSNATSNIEVISTNNITGLKPFEDNLENMESGVLNQRMGYYEVPLELSYALLNRKFGIHLIGGLSTLFLNENSVTVQSANTTMSLGKANNLNDIHFSSNVGLGFKYTFWENFEAHFEPTFKYQFNTFSRDAGNFKPYFVGLYSGVSFRF